MIRVLLIEASDVMRNALTRFLDSDPEIRLSGIASSLTDAIELAKHLFPDVVLLDLHSGDDKKTSASTIKSSFSRSRIIAMSLQNDDEAHVMADSFGAVELVDKMTLAADLISAIKRSGQPLSSVHAI